MTGQSRPIGGRGVGLAIAYVISLLCVISSLLIQTKAIRFGTRELEIDSDGNPWIPSKRKHTQKFGPEFGPPGWTDNGAFLGSETRKSPSRFTEPGKCKTGGDIGNDTSRANQQAGGCGTAPLNNIPKLRKRNRIINGADQNYGEWPSFARLSIDKRVAGGYGTISCGGTLVSERHVLTAAHCVYVTRKWRAQVVRPDGVTVILGDHDKHRTDRFEQLHRARSVCVAQNYKPDDNGSGNDWAIIELERPVKTNDYVSPACMPREPVQIEGRFSTCYVIGSGILSEDRTGHKIDATTVQKLRVEKVSCSPFGLSDSDRSRHCFAHHGEPQGDSCRGDSGGPVLCLNDAKRWLVVGVVSQGPPCYKHPRDPRLGIYVRVMNLLGDIQAQCRI